MNVFWRAIAAACALACSQAALAQPVCARFPELCATAPPPETWHECHKVVHRALGSRTSIAAGIALMNPQGQTTSFVAAWLEKHPYTDESYRLISRNNSNNPSVAVYIRNDHPPRIEYGNNAGAVASCTGRYLHAVLGPPLEDHLLVIYPMKFNREDIQP